MASGRALVYSGARLMVRHEPLRGHDSLGSTAKHGSVGVAGEYVIYSPHRGYVGNDTVSFFNYSGGAQSAPRGFRIEVLPLPEEMTGMDLRIETPDGTPAVALDKGPGPTQLVISNRRGAVPFPLSGRGGSVRLRFRTGAVREDKALEPGWHHPLGGEGGDWLWTAQREAARQNLGAEIIVDLAYRGEDREILAGGQLVVPLPDLVAPSIPAAAHSRMYGAIMRRVEIPGGAGEVTVMLERVQTLTRAMAFAADGGGTRGFSRNERPFSTALTCGEALDKRLKSAVMALSLSNRLDEAIGPAPVNSAPWISVQLDAATLPAPLCDVASMEDIKVAYVTADGRERIDLGAPVARLDDRRAVWTLRFFAERIDWLPGAHRTAQLVVSLVGADRESTPPERQTAAAIVRWGNFAKLDNGEAEISVPLWNGTPLVGGSGPDWGDEE